ncbi:MAG TPA: hypothetical protein VF755_29480 [Catenuloplanes sp.]
MTIAVQFAVLAALSAVWLTAGALADTLPDTTTARALRRRTQTMLLLVGAGTALLLAVPVLAAVLPGRSAAPLAAALPGIPAVVVLLTTWRRLAWLRRGSMAFAAAPDTPAPPALRAAAAHPLLATPLQVTALAAVAGLPIGAGLLAPAGANLAGLAITFVALAIGAIGVRHALRHSRLAESAVRVRAVSRSA